MRGERGEDKWRMNGFLTGSGPEGGGGRLQPLCLVVWLPLVMISGCVINMSSRHSLLKNSFQSLIAAHLKSLRQVQE